MILAFHKPYGVLSQFTQQEPEHKTLAEFELPPDFYPLGRLDWDSEGLLLLSDEPHLNEVLLNPRNEHERTYHAQVEGIATEEAMHHLEKGLEIQDYKTKPCKARLLADPQYKERNPPIRFRLDVPTSWVELKLREGKNRQVRHMTAAVNFPTLRLIRVAIGDFKLGKLPLGMWYELSPKERKELLRK